MAATCLSALGHVVGDSNVEVERLGFVQDIMDRAQRQGVSLRIPTDVVIGQSFDITTEPLNVQVTEIPTGWQIMDIGSVTTQAFIDELTIANTIIWNGPMGVYEWPQYLKGTKTVAESLSREDITSVIGGGSTVDAVSSLGLEARMDHVSTGGGASLEFLEGRDLPGIMSLMDV